jgi:polar amino acid transport system substrate-binding protein
MKKTGLKCVAVVVLLMCLFAATAMAATVEEIEARGKLVMLTSPGYFPFEMIGEEGEIIGFDVDIAKAIADALGVELEIVSIQWDGIIPALQTDKGDMIIAGLSITEERSKAILFSEPYYMTGLGVLANEKHKDIKAWSDLDVKGIKIGVRLGQTSDFYTEKFFKNAEILKFTSDSATMGAAVADGKIDAAIHDEPWVRVFARRNPKGVFPLVSEKHAEGPLGIAMQKGNDGLKKVVDDTMKTLMDSPKYKEILDYWFVDMPWFKD